MRCAGFMRVLTVCGFFAYLIAVSPHLVHHAFEQDHARPSCPFLVASQQGTSDGSLHPEPVAAPSVSGSLDTRSVIVSLASPATLHLPPRAPPSPLPAI